MNIPFLEKSIENLQVAEWCLEQGHFNACVNRSYYAMFQAVLVALIYHGVTKPDESHSHEWVQATFASELVWKKKIFPGYQSHLMNIQRRRNTADYESQRISRKHAERSFKMSKELIDKIM
ncbi:MAG: HEPN domain-containing protein [SAR324 cluster bacterium]|nr:HEPN domain-containing protein [SAR324 cluster bacterium]